ncbi:MAG TPA: hypothetical protein PKZ58_03805 [Bacillota bacterium]|nr:hypothetical protein [Clostridiales bacterium]HOQ14185.1 hypothetical protein [Bacillota bacterium]
MKTRKMLEYTAVFTAGAVLYSAIEVLWRGYTHPSMAATGGACLAAMYAYDKTHEKCPLPAKALYGACLITSAEFVVGCAVNLLLGQRVWDYSGFRFNLLGQICLLYSFLWYLLSIPAFLLCRFARRLFRAGSCEKKFNMI